MRLIEGVQVGASLLAVFGAALRLNIRRIERTLRNAGATSPASAVTLPSNRPLLRLTQRRLASAGAIECLSDGRCYIDPAGWHRWRRSRRRRALIAVGCVLMLSGVLWAVGVIR